MASPLAKNQLTLLEGFNKDKLITIINELVQDNQQAKSYLLTHWLKSSAMILADIEKEYKRLEKDQRFLDFYQTEAFFQQLLNNVLPLFDKTIYDHPEKTEKLVLKLLLDIERLTQSKEAESPAREQYIIKLFNIWIETLIAHGRINLNETVAKRVYEILQKCPCLCLEHLRPWANRLGGQVCGLLRNMYSLYNDTESVLLISLFMKDIDYVQQILRRFDGFSSKIYLDFVECLLSVEKYREAEIILNDIQLEADKALHLRWTRLKVQLLLSYQQPRQAKQMLIEQFSQRFEIEYYQLALDLLDSPDKLTTQFYSIAKSAGLEEEIRFLVDTEQFDVVDNLISKNQKVKKRQASTPLDVILTDSFARRLSALLHKAGYPQSAMWLRCKLVDDAIDGGKTRFYPLAAADAKQAFDYGVACKNEQVYQWFSDFYQKHKQKHTFWKLVMGRNKELKIVDGALVFQR